MLKRKFVPAGPVAEAFRASTAEVCCIMGPVGSMKTTTSIVKILQKAMMQPPVEVTDPTTGERRMESGYRVISVRNTAGDLWRGTIPSWKQWVQTEGPGTSFKGSEGRPAYHSARFWHQNKKHMINFEAWFIAPGPDADEEAIENMFQGLEPSDVYCNEINKLNPLIRRHAFGRIGRYNAYAPTVQPQVICDMNAPDAYNWTVPYFIYDRPKNVAFFRQPGGLEPNAENRKFWGREKYEAIAEANKDDPGYVRRMVHNKIGKIKDGVPVYDDDFDETIHVEEGILPDPRYPVHIAMDGGRKPAAILFQIDQLGCMTVHAEIWLNHAGPDKFARAVLKLKDEIFPGFPWAKENWVDPSAENPTESSRETEDGADHTFMLIMSDLLDCRIKPAPGQNDPMIRQGSARHFMHGRVGNRSMLKISRERCPFLIRTLEQGYKYPKIKGARDYVDTKPMKNDNSHMAEAFEYGCCGAGGYQAVMRKGKKRTAPRRKPARRYDPISRHRVKA